MLLYLIVDAAACGERGAVQTAREAANNGVSLIQLRDFTSHDSEYCETATAIMDAISGTDAKFIVGERPHLVQRLGAHGVHIGEKYRDIRTAREEIGCQALLGVSGFTAEQIVADVGADFSVDYLSVGPGWETVSKPDAGAAIGPEQAEARAAGSPFASMLIGGIGAGLFALLMEQLLITRMYERHIDQALVTVGVSLVVGAALGGWFGNDLVQYPTPSYFLNGVNVFGAIIPADRFFYIGTAVLLLIANWALLKYTRIGLIIRAGVENRSMVAALGINVRRAFSTVFFLGGFAAGIGGVLVSVYANGVSPLIAGQYLIYGFIVVVIGGMGSVPGSFLSAMMIGVIRQFANYYITGLGDFVVVILLAGVLLIRPQGLLGKVAA